MRQQLSHLLLLLAVVMITCPASAFAAASVTVSPTGETTYTIQGANMDGIAGIQLDLFYDRSSLGTPTVTQGSLVSGAMLAANTNVPGIIKIAIISTRTFSGNGQVASITFASKTGSGGITSVSASMIDSKGAGVAATAMVQTSDTSTAANSTPGIPFSQPSQTTTPTTQQGSSSSGTAVTSTTSPTYLGTVTMPGDAQRSEVYSAKSPILPASSGEQNIATRSPERNNSQPAKSPVESKAEETPQLVVYKGVPERFKLYKGNKGLPEMAALFEKKVSQFISQTPPIVLNDGQKKVLLTIDLPNRITSSPNFAVNGGKLLSFKQDKGTKGRWLVEVLPENNSYKTVVTIIAGSDEFEYPLTVAPVIKTALTLDSTGWRTFLKDTGTPQVPHQDLNNDGVRDYLDEYIFIANYLAAEKVAPVKPAAAPATKKSKKK